MPHLNLQIGPLGPVMDVAVAVSSLRADALTLAKQAIPDAIVIRALVDTGASCSCVDPDVLTSLGLTPTGSASIHTPSTGGIAAHYDQYDVDLMLTHPKLVLNVQNVPVVATELGMQGIQGLIGRDVLENCLLIYDGQSKEFTISI
ncbi:MAG: retropepsin-like aspartic protease [Pyrinomonadaceae bacterium]